MTTTILMIALLILMIAFGMVFGAMVGFKRRAEIAEATLDAFQQDYSRLQTERHEICRLKAINRNGRMNTFTFVRNGLDFNIETMGLMSDDIGTWKMQAGISDFTRKGN